MRPHNMLPPVRLVAPGGPVSAAIRAMRADEPATDYTRLLTLRRAIEDRIEADIALLDALDGDPDIEDEGHSEPALGSLGSTADTRGCSQLGWSRGCDDDREDGDDSGIGDVGGLAEQRGRHIRRQAAIAAAEASDRRAPRLRLIDGGAR